jgi:hypothetical protein
MTMKGSGGNGNSRVPPTRPRRPRYGFIASVAAQTQDCHSECSRRFVPDHRPQRATNELALGRKDLFQTCPNFSVCQEVAPIKLIEACRYLSPKPGIVIEIVFHQLLDVLVRMAMYICGDAVKLGLQLGRKMHFHYPQVRETRDVASSTRGGAAELPPITRRA